jgi:hypothetical protein
MAKIVREAYSNRKILWRKKSSAGVGAAVLAHLASDTLANLSHF